MQEITITKPDDWHLHLRDGLFLEHTVPATAQHFARALVMPNLKPALTTVNSLLDYRKRILDALTENHGFTPYLSLYLNDLVSAEELELAKNHTFILGAKLYPAGATTNSDEGVQSLRALYPQFEVMQSQNLVLQIHGEVTQGDIFHRESRFIQQELTALIHDFPRLRIVLEHISSKAAVDFICDSSEHVAATITPHHLLYNRNQMLAGGIKPHLYCLPILKRESDQKALQEAAISGNPKFFAGTDSAPHAVKNKESSCGCAGIFSAPYALALYAQVFEYCEKLPRLESFLSHFGAVFYQLAINKEQVTLKKQPQLVPAMLPFGNEQVVPIAAGDTLAWSVL
ncbi:dihydroorotase [Legionella jordanis]|uniref:Dihydroorotase n=1 Tax=Legionella jordanis TaxID=456 RepID=A0A0W0VDQ4_9GAMM|nr:dihydroorotase [Legionella jordanis]KTD18013.1 dihydroorotase, homodimeric type [Legionella jordanis]RMX02298.1 dihydroorotase [Legionella jordanis]RMX21217.1 dihydroorotase [Legionella jordanis]VEH13895.1 dihydroorotase, homodimeric type [Legionella jordanis]